MTKAGKIEPEASPLALGAAHIRQLREARAKLLSEVPRLTALVQAAEGHSSEIESLQRARIESAALHSSIRPSPIRARLMSALSKLNALLRRRLMTVQRHAPRWK